MTRVLLPMCICLLMSGCRGVIDPQWQTPRPQSFELRQNSVAAIVYSPDGKLLATVHTSLIGLTSRISMIGIPPAFVKVWDAEGNGDYTKFQVEDGSQQTVQFSPDGSTIVVRSGKKLLYWDIKRQALRTARFELVGAMSPDSRWIVHYEGENGMSVVDAATHEVWRNFPAKPDRIALGFSPDSSLLALEHISREKYGRIEVWNLTTGELQARLHGLGSSIHCWSFSPDGQLIAGAPIDELYIHIWDTDTGQQRSRLGPHSSDIWCIAFSPDGRIIASGGKGNELTLWNVARQSELTSIIDDSTEEITALAFSPDGSKLAVGDIDGRINVWNVAELESKESR